MKYRKDNTYDVSQFLGLVHKELIKKYTNSSRLKDQNKKARDIQIFFQNIKKISRGGKVTTFGQAGFYEAVFNALRAAGINVNNLFRTTSSTQKDSNKVGAIFEREVGAILDVIFGTGERDQSGRYTSTIPASVVGGEKSYLNKITEDYFKKVENKININYDKKGRLFFSAKDSTEDGIIDHLQKSAINILIEENYLPKRIKKIKDAKDQADREYSFITDLGVDQKVDVKVADGAKLSIQGEYRLTPQLERTLETIRTSTFSLKSYKGGSISLGLGNTNPIKAYFGILSSLPPRFSSNGAASSSFLHALNLKNSDKMEESHYFNHRKNGTRIERWNKVAVNIYQMRFIYELTGAGQVGKDKTLLPQVDFFIYNQSNTDKIYVFSVEGLINTMMQEKQDIENINRADPFKGRMSIDLRWKNIPGFRG